MLNSFTHNSSQVTIDVRHDLQCSDMLDFEPTEHDTCHTISTIHRIKQLQSSVFNCTINEGWNFNSGNYLFTSDTK